LPVSRWTPIATLTNSTGIISFVDKSSNSSQRFYTAEQMPP
jgi:hypothetical protein